MSGDVQTNDYHDASSTANFTDPNLSPAHSSADGTFVPPNLNQGHPCTVQACHSTAANLLEDATDAERHVASNGPTLTSVLSWLGFGGELEVATALDPQTGPAVNYVALDRMLDLEKDLANALRAKANLTEDKDRLSKDNALLRSSLTTSQLKIGGLLGQVETQDAKISELKGELEELNITNDYYKAKIKVIQMKRERAADLKEVNDSVLQMGQ